jgi:hypothetical protein
MTRIYSLTFLLLSFFSICHAQQKGENALLEIMHQHPEQFDSILAHKDRYRLQIVYTRIERDKQNQPHVTTWAMDTDRYFYYPASMIKLLEIPLAMEKISMLKKKYGVSIYDSLVVSGDPCGDLGEVNYMKRPNFSTPAQMIKEMLLVSNNHAFNPLYDFLGQAYYNKRAHELGYPSAIVCGRFAGCDTFQNRTTSTVDFYNRETGALKYVQPAAINPDQPEIKHMNTVVGKGFMNGTHMDPPKNFNHNNYISLWDLNKLLVRLTLPKLQPKKQQLHLTTADYAFIHKYMGMFLHECVFPKYDGPENPDCKYKFFMTPADVSGKAPDGVRIFNKVGQAYGFVTDCSYFADTINKVEFFLSCSIYVCKNEILNADVYEYESIAMPFFRNLCNAIYTDELSRKRKHKPVFEPWDFSDKVF